MSFDMPARNHISDSDGNRQYEFEIYQPEVCVHRPQTNHFNKRRYTLRSVYDEI